MLRPLSTLKALFDEIYSCDCVITSKFQGVSLLHPTNKPVIALSYMHKIGDLMRTVGHEQYCPDIEHIELRELIESFESMMNERGHLATQRQSTSATYPDALQAHFDAAFGEDGVTGRRMSANEVARAAM